MSTGKQRNSTFDKVPSGFRLLACSHSDTLCSVLGNALDVRRVGWTDVTVQHRVQELLQVKPWLIQERKQIEVKCVLSLEEC